MAKRGRPKLGKDKRQKAVMVRFTPAQYTALRGKSHPVPVAAWLRELALSALG